MHKVGLPNPKITTSKRQRWILFVLVGLFLFATGVYATREHVVHPTGATTALAH
jgi:hypothetical protein